MKNYWKTGLRLLFVMLVVCMMAVPVMAAEVTGNNWIFPVTKRKGLGCEQGCTSCPKLHTKEAPHEGYDITANKGRPILAMRSGTVVSARNSCNYSHLKEKNDCPKGKTYMSGNYVKLKHTYTENGKTVTRYTVYFHMTRAAVAEGDWVEQGDIIGYVGRTGNATGYHTCVEFRKTIGGDGTSMINTLVENTAASAAASYDSTIHRPTLRITLKNITIWNTPVYNLRKKVGTIPEGVEILCTIIQENYGFVEYEDMKGWVYLPDNTKHLKKAVQLDFYKNNGKGKMSNITCVSGEDIQLPANRFTRSGYAFVGWQLYNPYTQVWLYTDGTNYTWAKSRPTGYLPVCIPDEGVLPGEFDLANNVNVLVRMIAVWKVADAPEYTVRYDPNGGTGTMADTSGTRGMADPISPCTFENEGYAFVGWTASRQSDDKWLYQPTDGSASATWLTEEDAAAKGWPLYRYADGGTTTSPTTVDGDVITLHAQWAMSALRLEPENGDDCWYLPIEAATALGTLPIPQREGYHFLGWFTDPDDGEQIISLYTPENDVLTDITTLYAHWLPHEDRPVMEQYVNRTSEDNQYILALSHLLSASGQQPDGTYTADQCYDQLDSVGMISSNGGVYNKQYSSTGFLEYFAPELTLEEKVTCDNYEAYVETLASMQEQGYYFLLMLQLDANTTQWCYLYAVDGDALLVVYDGVLTDAADICQGIASTNVFLYHGTEFYSARPCMEGSCVQEEDTIHITLDVSASGLDTGRQSVVVAFYQEDGRMLGCTEQSVRLDSYLQGELDIRHSEDFDICQIFFADNWYPLCAPLELSIYTE